MTSPQRAYRFGTPRNARRRCSETRHRFGKGYAKMTYPFQRLPAKGALLYMGTMYVRLTARMHAHPGCFASLKLRAKARHCVLSAPPANSCDCNLDVEKK